MAHHVGTHQRTVGVVVLQEGDQAGGNGGDLVRGHVHQLQFLRFHYGEVAHLAGLHALAGEFAGLRHLGVGLGDHLHVLLLGAEVGGRALQVHLAVLHLTVGRFDEAQAVDLAVHAKRTDQTDVRSFRRLDGAEAAIVRVMHVAHLETGALAAETSWPECREAAFVGDLRQRVGLIHELAQLVRSEERIDHRAQGLGIDEVRGSEHLVITHVHALSDGAGHTRQTHAELAEQLLAHGADAAVAQVVDVVHIGLGVHQFDKVTDDGDDVLLGEHPHAELTFEAQFFVDAVAAHLTEVVALLAEEQLVDHAASRLQIGGLSVAQLAVDHLHGLLLGVRGVFLQGVVDQGIVGRVHAQLVQDDRLGAALEDLLHVLLLQDRLAVDQHLVPFDRDHLTGILVHEILHPALQHTGGELAAHGILQGGLGHLDLIGQAEDLQDLLVTFETDGTQQRCHR